MESELDLPTTLMSYISLATKLLLKLKGKKKEKKNPTGKSHFTLRFYT